MDERTATDPRAETDDQVRLRRHGDQLHEAIHRACLDELAEHGYDRLTMDRVAARARTGKATLYRRWPNKVELVISTLRHVVPRFEPPPDVGDLREELLVLFRAMADELGGPTGAACRGLIVEVVRNPELGELLDRQVMDPLVPPTIEVFRRSVVRGELSPAALTPRVASVGSDLLLQHFLLHGTSAPEPVLVELVDQVVLPLLRGLGAPAGPAGGSG